MKIRQVIYAGILFIILGFVALFVTLATTPTEYPWQDNMISRPPWINIAYIESYIQTGTIIAVFLWATGVILATFAVLFWQWGRWETNTPSLSFC